MVVPYEREANVREKSFTSLCIVNQSVSNIIKKENFILAIPFAYHVTRNEDQISSIQQACQFLLGQHFRYP